ncbi:MAG: hypothetical protein H0U52_03475 [Chloroflexi bacterium]|nr:hypothetical protein [Chloroflexota bacterium]
MPTSRLFRAAAIAWFLTAAARVLVAVLRIGPASETGTFVSTLGGVAVGVTGAWLLWTRPDRRSAIITTLFGFYAVLGIAYLPLIGLESWFIVLIGTGVLAFVLSLACLIVAWRQPPTAA